MISWKILKGMPRVGGPSWYKNATRSLIAGAKAIPFCHSSAEAWFPNTSACQLVARIQGHAVVASIQLASKSAPTLSGTLLAMGGMKFAMRWLMRSQSTEEA